MFLYFAAKTDSQRSDLEAHIKTSWKLGSMKTGRHKNRGICHFEKPFPPDTRHDLAMKQREAQWPSINQILSANTSLLSAAQLRPHWKAPEPWPWIRYDTAIQGLRNKDVKPTDDAGGCEVSSLNSTTEERRGPKVAMFQSLNQPLITAKREERNTQFHNPVEKSRAIYYCKREGEQQCITNHCRGVLSED